MEEKKPVTGEPTDLAKSLESALAKFDGTLTKINERLDAQETANTDITKAVEAMAGIVAKLAGSPAPLKGVSPVAITKGADSPITGGTLPGADGPVAKVVDTDDLRTSMTKALHASNARPLDPSDPRAARS